MMNPLIRSWLDHRHLNAETWHDLERPSAQPLHHIDELTDLLHTLHTQQQRVVILPDFDMDGITAGTLGFAGLSLMGFTVSLYRPDPSAGYGFTEHDIDKIFDEFPDTRAVLTCDVGITAHEGVQRIHERGALALITDHHVQEEELAADCIVNPNQLGETYEHPSICGAHVLWQVLDRYAECFVPDARDAIQILRVFAGFGTISDQMTLSGENRSLVRDATVLTQRIFMDPKPYTTGNANFDSALYGLHTILRVLQEHGKFSDINELNEQFMGFYLAPTFNSAKRMNGSMDDVFGIFFNANRSYELAQKLFVLNEQRKRAVGQYMKELETSDQPYAPYVYLTNAPTGILGLLATKLISSSHMPTFVLNRETLQGSGRTPEWYKALDVLTPLGHHVAGHQHAFGVHSSTDDLPKLAADIAATAETLQSQADTKPQEADIVLALGPQAANDAGTITQWDNATVLEYCEKIRSYAPFGAGFPAPTIQLNLMPQDIAQLRCAGAQQQHLLATTTNGLSLTLFNQADYAALMQHEPVTITGTLERNVWRGEVRAQMQGTIATPQTPRE